VVDLSDVMLEESGCVVFPCLPMGGTSKSQKLGGDDASDWNARVTDAAALAVLGAVLVRRMRA